MKLIYLLNRYYCIDVGSSGNDLVSKMDLEGQEDANNPISPEKYPSEHRNQENVEMDLDDPMIFASSHQIEKLKKQFIRRTKGYGVSELEKLHAVICQEFRSQADFDDRNWAFQVLKQSIAGVKVNVDSEH